MTTFKAALGSAGRIVLGVMAGIAVIEAVLLIVCLNPPQAAAPVTVLPGICTPTQIAESNVSSKERATRFPALARASKLIRTDAKGLEQWETPEGTYWIPKGDSKGLFQVLAELEGVGTYRVPEVGIHPGDVVLDVGASYGIFVRKALAEGAAKVVAIEPAPAVNECLRRNLADEIAAGRVLVVDKGAWDQDASLHMDLRPGYTIAARISDSIGLPGPNDVIIPVTTIDKMVAELKLEKVDFIKMDIEGAEEKALPGSAQTIARFRPRMAVCVYHKPNHPLLLANLIREIVPDYRQRSACQNWSGVFVHEVDFFW